MTSPFDMPEDGVVMISGRKEDLDMAILWVRANLHGIFGFVHGELIYNRIPAMKSLLLYSRVRMNMPDV